jgi:hypothetical protein
MGDININLLRSDSCKYTQHFLLSLQSYNFIPTIDKPTRVHNNSATLIDNIFVNNIENDACDVTLSIYAHRASLKNMPFQACPVWIYTQSNITGIIFT